MNHRLITLTSLLAFCLPAFGKAVYVDPATDEANLNLTGRFLFWNPTEQVAGYRNIDKVFSTREIKAGTNVYPLPATPRDFSALRYKVGEDTFSLEDFIDHNNITGLLVLKDGNIVLERYEAGNSETSRWVSFSIAKSVTSMLIGAAVKDGYIRSVDDKVTDYLPRLKGSSYGEVTVRDVLQMASGTEWNEDYADPDSDVNTTPADPVNLFAALGAKKRLHPPGTVFNYNTGETNLAGALLRAAIGNNLATYLTHKIWIPFGMEHDANWMLDGPGGGELGGCCINATLRDYGRIGLFAMQGGVLKDGTPVLPSDWMQASTTPSKGSEGYGYLWWLWNDGPYAGLGIFGQLIYINPARNLVIVTHSAWPTAVGREFSQHRTGFINGVVEYLSAP